MKRYEKYKDSGVEWIGEIPEGWETCLSKYKLSVITDGAHTSPETENGIYPFVSTVDLNNGRFNLNNCLLTSKENFKLLKAQGSMPLVGDVLFSKDGTIGKTIVIEEKFDFVVASSLIIMRPIAGELSPKYLNYLLQSSIALEQINSFVKGVALRRLSLLNLKKIIGVFPPIKEQTVIANYLDRKTAEIDELVAQKERLLLLYEEEKNAIINQAVTKGINPDVKLKDSGIDWLGEIPEHWAVKKLKYVAEANPSNIDKKSKDGEKAILLCNYVNVYKNEFISSELDFMKATVNKDQIRKFSLEKSDVIATKDSEAPDDIAIPALVVENFENVVCGYHLTHIKPKNINGEYLFRYFQTKYLSSYFEVSANGVTRYGLGVDKFNSALILNPPKPEQTAIVQHIETETARINAKIEKTKKIIALQKEYRTALISEVVTGKIKVTQEQEQ